MSEHNVEKECPHLRVESRQKFDGTVLWRCLDCGADSRDDITVAPRFSPEGNH